MKRWIFISVGFPKSAYFDDFQFEIMIRSKIWFSIRFEIAKICPVVPVPCNTKFTNGTYFMILLLRGEHWSVGDNKESCAYIADMV